VIVMSSCRHLICELIGEGACRIASAGPSSIVCSAPPVTM
jgi:hypothetical protein